MRSAGERVKYARQARNLPPYGTSDDENALQEETMHRFRPIPVVAIATCVIVLAACTGDTGATSAAAEESAAESHAGMSMEASQADGGGDADTVVISGFDFGDDITVPAGTTVTFQNDDDAAHTVTEGTDGSPAEGAAFDEEVEGGASVEITFDEAGTFDVTCRFHPDMQMTVTVE
jgi:plastocyanin